MLSDIIKIFRVNRGGWVATAMLISKIASFALTFFVIYLLSENQYGTSVKALNFLSFFLVFNGFGVANGTLKYGVLLEGKEKKDLLNYSFTYGFVFQLVSCVVMLIIGTLLYSTETLMLQLLFVLSLRYLAIFFLEYSKVEARVNFNNKLFSIIDIVNALLALVLALGGAFLWGLWGYVIGLTIAPFVTLFFIRAKINFTIPHFQKFSLKEFWRFSVVASASTQLIEWVAVFNIFFIGIHLNDEAVANYRISSLLPLNLATIGIVLFMRDYPNLCKEYLSRSYQIQYLKSYYKTVGVLILFSACIGFVFSEHILLIFGQRETSIDVFRISLVVMFTNLLIYIPFIYLLPAIGKPHHVLIISLITSIVAIIGFPIAIEKYNLIGAAWFTEFTFLFSGILFSIMYFYSLNKLKI